MSNRASDLNRWLITECKANINTTVYVGIAPEGVCHPFITLNIIGDNPKYTTCEDIGTYDVQFSVFETAERLSNVHDIIDELRDYFDDRQDSVDGIDIVQYTNNYILNDPENKGWQGILQYRIHME